MKIQRRPQWIERRAKSVWKTRPWAVRNLSLLKQTKWYFYSVELFSLQLIKLPPNDAFFKHTTGSHYGGQIRRLQNVLVLVYKCVNGLMPTYLSSNFVERNSGYDLRCKRITRSSEIDCHRSHSIVLLICFVSFHSDILATMLLFHLNVEVRFIYLSI